MTYIVQPPSGTALDSTWLAKGIVFARNEADTVVTDTCGTADRTIAGSGVVWGFDADGRYKQAGAAEGSLEPLEEWSGVAIGPTLTILVVAKRVNNGDFQSPVDSDGGSGSNRNFIFRFDASGVLQFISFDSSGSPNTAGSPTSLVGTSGPSVLVARTRVVGNTFASQCWVDGEAGSEVVFPGPATASSIASTDYFAVASGRVGGSHRFDSKSYQTVVFNADLSDTDVSALLANPWQVWSAGGATSPSSSKGTVARLHYEILIGRSNV